MQEDKDGRENALLEECKRSTRKYRETALQILVAEQDEVSSQIAEHFLDKLWEEEDVSKGSHTQTMYGCQACGYVLHPGYEGTSLRVKRVTAKKGSLSTLRRRQQRKHQKLAATNQRGSKDTNSLNRRTKNSDSESAESVRMVLLSEDPHLVLDRHHLEIKCGRCQHKTLIKGLARERPTTKQDVQKQQAVSWSTKQRIKKREAASMVQDDVKDSSDFLALPPAATSKNSKKPAPKSIPTFKKKKKKRGNQGNNKLMNFLSSLND